MSVVVVMVEVLGGLKRLREEERELGLNSQVSMFVTGARDERRHNVHYNPCLFVASSHVSFLMLLHLRRSSDSLLRTALP